MIQTNTYNRIENDSYFYFEENCCLRRDEPWLQGANGGKGDGLWRTGIAYATWGEAKFFQGILNCFKMKYDDRGSYIQGYRFPNYKSKDFSRDQLTSALAALKINNRNTTVWCIAKHLRYRISDKFKMTPDMFIWVKAISSKNIIARQLLSNLFALIGFWYIFTYGIWTKLILYKWAGVKEISHNEYDVLIKNNNWTKASYSDYKRVEKMRHIMTPPFAYHLFAWQVEALDCCILKPVLKFFARIPANKSNYLLKLFFGGKVKQSDIDNYQPHDGFRWQRSFYKLKKGKVLFYEGEGLLATHPAFFTYVSESNALDCDILHTFASKHKKQIV